MTSTTALRTPASLSTDARLDDLERRVKALEQENAELKSELSRVKEELKDATQRVDWAEGEMVQLVASSPSPPEPDDSPEADE